MKCFNVKFFFTIVCVIIFFSLKAQEKKAPLVNTGRLEKNLKILSEFGINSEKGNDRIAYSDYDIAARNYLIKYLENIDTQVKIDYAGNILAVRKGLKNNLKPISFGSHIDAVPNGGHYDGDVGVISAIEVMEILHENKIFTNHPLELIIFSNEEGAVFGSRAIAGKIDIKTLEVITSSGYTNGEGVKRIGGVPEKVLEVKRSNSDVHAFLELHIEQGNILHSNKIDIGIVEGIVGLKWWDVEISGFTNHAGTTPMNDRKDAMIAAAKFVLAVNNTVKSIPGSQVGTVGRISAFPGAPNVIPGKVILSLELRDLNAEKIELLFEMIKEESKVIGIETKTKFEFKPIDATAEPALTDERIQEIIRVSAEELGYSKKTMPSGAGHDAQDMAIITPTGMIFIPSIDGISHSPKEFSTSESIAKGANVLLRSIIKIDKIKLD
jgi:N-carbamoyl-L-amino-acid hydrolase